MKLLIYTVIFIHTQYSRACADRKCRELPAKKRERELAAALCQKLDVFLPTAKRKATGDGQQSDPLVTETNSATAAATEEIECSDHSDKCKTTCSEMVAPDSNEPEITTQQGASSMHCSVYNILASLYD